MSAQITVLYDNRCGNPNMQEGWGFSAFIEFGNSKILFDTGGDYSTFCANAERAQLPFKEITHLLFSHRHWDHLTGFQDILAKLSPEAALFVPKTFPWKLVRHGKRALKTTVTRSFAEIAPNVYSLVLRGGFWLHEQILILKTPQGLGIITGCAHPGIVTIIKEAQHHIQQPIAFVLGGFHELFTPPLKTSAIVEQFKRLGVQKVAPCHCSGDHLIRQFEGAYGPDYHKVGTGTILRF